MRQGLLQPSLGECFLLCLAPAPGVQPGPSEVLQATATWLQKWGEGQIQVLAKGLLVRF